MCYYVVARCTATVNNVYNNIITVRAHSDHPVYIYRNKTYTMGIRAETGSHGIIAVAVAQSLLIDSHSLCSPSQQVWGLAPHTLTLTHAHANAYA